MSWPRGRILEWIDDDWGRKCGMWRIMTWRSYIRHNLRVFGLYGIDAVLGTDTMSKVRNRIKGISSCRLSGITTPSHPFIEISPLPLIDLFLKQHALNPSIVDDVIVVMIEEVVFIGGEIS
ncbi:450_t:CDS:1 [Paraglomus brasilianum]|uniref:450_t:CDS:1 n=1 Tax=Paraglomus brasilianum TaxID=144538 RepID=A0A9N9G6Q9_9GLOM|nr:450_t:CDS:1 [Paraglomus brasilianum]